MYVTFPVPKWYIAVSWSGIRIPVYFFRNSISPSAFRLFSSFPSYSTVSLMLKLRIKLCSSFSLTTVSSDDTTSCFSNLSLKHFTSHGDQCTNLWCDLPVMTLIHPHGMLPVCCLQVQNGFFLQIVQFNAESGTGE